MGVVHGGDELLELHGGSEVAEVVNNGAGLGEDEEDALAGAVDLDPAVHVAAEAAGHGVEGDKRLSQCVLEDLRLKEVGGAIGSVEVNAGSVEPGHHQVNVGVPKAPYRRRLRRRHHRLFLHCYDHLGLSLQYDG